MTPAPAPRYFHGTVLHRLFQELMIRLFWRQHISWLTPRWSAENLTQCSLFELSWLRRSRVLVVSDIPWQFITGLCSFCTWHNIEALQLYVFEHCLRGLSETANEIDCADYHIAPRHPSCTVTTCSIYERDTQPNEHGDLEVALHY